MWLDALDWETVKGDQLQSEVLILRSDLQTVQRAAEECIRRPGGLGPVQLPVLQDAVLQATEMSRRFEESLLLIALDSVLAQYRDVGVTVHRATPYATQAWLHWYRLELLHTYEIPSRDASH